MPDYLNLQHKQAEVEQIVSKMGDEVEENYDNIMDSMDDPMPFWLFDAERVDDQVRLSWETAYDFEGASFTYDITVSRYPDMRDPLFSQQGMITTEVTIPQSTLGTGEIYWRVIATREDGQTVNAMNQIEVNELIYPGVYSFTLQ